MGLSDDSSNDSWINYIKCISICRNNYFKFFIQKGVWWNKVCRT